MKDMIGRDIKVGDKIAYASKPYCGVRLTIGTVIAVDENSIKVERIHAGGRNGVKDNLQVKRTWNVETTKFVDTIVKPRTTTVCMSGRCCIVNDS